MHVSPHGVLRISVAQGVASAILLLSNLQLSVPGDLRVQFCFSANCECHSVSQRIVILKMPVHMQLLQKALATTLYKANGDTIQFAPTDEDPGAMK